MTNQLNPELNIEGLMEALEDVHFHWTMFRNSTDPVNQASRLVDLGDSISDLITYHPSYDNDTGTLGWEHGGEDDDEDETDEWTPTHMSVHDGSLVRCLWDDPFMIENEDGERWTDNPNEWAPWPS
jgi:hypothetical protein